MEMGKVSILMTAYNCINYIDQAVKSVLSQSYLDFELCIVDDCSTDGTREYLSALKHNKIKVYYNEYNMGYLNSFNFILNMASGEFITFLDGDDYLANNKIEKQVNFMISHNYEVSGTQYYKIDEKDNQISSVSNLPINREQMQRAIQCGDMPCVGSSIMITRKVLDNIGGYRDYFSGIPGEDIDWISRILDKFDGANINEALYYYRFHSNSLTRKVHTTVKARHVREIIAFLSEERKLMLGKDSLSLDTSPTPLDSFIDEIEQNYIKDKFLMERKVIFDCAVNGQFNLAFNKLKQVIFSDDWRSFNKNLKVFFYIVILYLFPSSLLLKVMGILNVKNITSRM
ncbi:glycosyltransferase family 2 protein [Aliivibrio fischeri]|uniref:glycosyltransferase family 2 protein n=1 Tax=Aliivibrio fischeri TaxID=668 RepID=UPI0012DA40C8|nr:glycosyltransferase family 2 protein [Aliivibrio fischeri]MUL16629.1 glycosyltransferase [Aliivibrio fischeri]